MTVDQNSDRDAKSYCAALAAQYQRVTLHGMDADGILSVVGRWQGGHAKRGNIEQGPLPRVQRARPVDIIEGEVETSIHDIPEDEDVDVQADAQAAQEYLDETSNEDEAESGETYEGYCVKCREKREFHGHVEETDSGRRMAKGTCPVCGTKMNRILANLPHHDQESFDTPDDPADVETEVKAAVVAAAEGVPADEIAEVVSEVAVEFSEAAQAAEQAPAKATRRPPRPRKSDVAKAKEDKKPEFGQAQCFKCGQTEDIAEAGGIRVLVEHSTESGTRCAGSRSVVQ
jgi:hypothetical protein